MERRDVSGLASIPKTAAAEVPRFGPSCNRPSFSIPTSSLSPGRTPRCMSTSLRRVICPFAVTVRVMPRFRLRWRGVESKALVSCFQIGALRQQGPFHATESARAKSRDAPLGRTGPCLPAQSARGLPAAGRTDLAFPAPSARGLPAAWTNRPRLPGTVDSRLARRWTNRPCLPGAVGSWLVRPLDEATLPSPGFHPTCLPAYATRYPFPLGPDACGERVPVSPRLSIPRACGRIPPPGPPSIHGSPAPPSIQRLVSHVRQHRDPLRRQQESPSKTGR